MRKRRGRNRGLSTATRKKNSRFMRDSFLIICEGKKTEPNYFNSFKSILKIDIRSVGIGKSPQHVVERARKELKKAKRRYQQVWCVFDKDHFTNLEFNNAIKEARALFLDNLERKERKEPNDLNNQKGSAHSNEAFELWFLLHFEMRTIATPRADFQKLLTKHLGKKYEKNALDIFDLLQGKMHTAIQNSQKLWIKKSHLPQHKANPITAVHLLVNELLKNRKE